ncbi:MAG: SAM hydrolase/SAM-dependent halogenase family protein [Candidatus Latescibacterota bacterium]
METSGIVTLTTDFGTRDPYAGIMKGMVLTANPDARLVDITHEIPAQDILNAAFTLMRAYDFFPPGTVHVAVVDPEVGGNRKNIAVLTEHYLFVGPDNGIFGMVFQQERALEIREILNSPFVTERVSNTFHGRDVFAPCAGYLSAGRNIQEVGPGLKNIVQLKYPRPVQNGNILTGEVVTVDSFGNLITNIPEHMFRSFVGKQKVEIFFATERFTTVHRHYSEVAPGTALALFGSSCYLEISMSAGSARDYFMTAAGSTVTVRRV